MNIDSIKNGIVLDHIRAGRGMQIYNSLGLDQLDCSVAIIKNVKSSKMGKKDIIKISDAFEVNFDVLGYIDPVSSVVFSIFLLREPFSIYQLIGGVIILLSAVIAERNPKPKTIENGEINL